ncbi:MAG: alpha/beta hydrolase [Gammaproteobacteria bacterium]|nr:alpha/beta hydrolase [Gammaproteobacteria bacterium]
MRTETLLAILLLVLALPASADTLDLSVHRNLPWSPEPLAESRGLLDVYQPAGAEEAPVVLFFHGGGLLAGDKSLAAHLGQRLAREGFVTVSANYRLSPAVSHPVHVRDAARTVAWVRDNIAGFGGDPDRVVLAGHSAGAWLAALLATDPRWLEERGLSRASLAGVVPISGFFHLPRLAPERPKSVWGEDPEVWRRASPARHVDEGVPAMLLIHAEGDTGARRKESRDFAAELEEAGVDVRGLEVPDRDHRSIFFLMGTPDDPATEALIQFVRSRPAVR